MIQLYDLGDGIWKICCEKHGSFKSGSDLVFRKALNWGIPYSELEYAIESMLRSDHDYADFGIKKSFLFSSKLKRAS